MILCSIFKNQTIEQQICQYERKKNLGVTAAGNECESIRQKSVGHVASRVRRTTREGRKEEGTQVNGQGMKEREGKPAPGMQV